MSGDTGKMFRLFLITPAILWLVVFFVLPLLLPIYYSFSGTVGAGGPDVAGFPTIQTYARLIDPIYGPIFTRTMVQAIVATITICVLGFPLAYFLATRTSTWKVTLLALVALPAWTSFLVRTYAWMVLLGAGGPVDSIIQWLTRAAEPPKILFTPSAVWIGLVYNYMPLAVLPLWAALERLEASMLEASKDLGAGSFYTLRHVTVPMAIPGIATATVLVFIPLAGEYVIPTLLGGQKVSFVGSIVVDQFQLSRDWAFGSAMAISLVALTMMTLALYMLMLRPALKRATR